MFKKYCPISVPLSEAARLLNMSPARVLKLVQAGKLRATVVGNASHIMSASLVSFQAETGEEA